MKQLNKTAGLLAAIMLLAASVNAQKIAERVKYDSIAAKYKNEHAVYTNYTEKLEIKTDPDDGSLEANTYVTMDKLLISDLSPTTENRDYFTFDDFNQLSDVSCISFIPDKKGGYKREDHNYGFGLAGQITGSFYDAVRLVMAYYTALPKGTVTETKYTLSNTDVTLLNSFYFLQDLPVLSATYEVVAPDYVNLSFSIKNTDAIHIKQDKEIKDGKAIYTFTATNLRAVKHYNLVPSAKYYLPIITPYITSYRLTGAKKDSVILRDADALYKRDYAFVKDLNIRQDTGLVHAAERVTKNDKTDLEKAEHIYKWVQDHIHYIAFESGMQGFVPRPADTVYKRMYGDCKDMASITMAMCRQVGLKAYFAAIGTTVIPDMIEDLPTEDCFNHVICAVKLGEEWVFLDGTENVLPFGANRHDIQGKEAFVEIDANHYKIVKIPVVDAGKNTTTDSTVMHIESKDLKGSLKQYTTGYPAWNIAYLKKYRNGKDLDDEMRDMLMRGSDKFTQVKYELNPSSKGNKDAHISASFSLDDYAHKVGDEYIVNMNLQRTYGDERMNDSERKVGYYFPYKEKIKQVVVLDIPEGYKVAHLPGNAHGGLEGVWSYSISYKADKKQVVLTKEYERQSLSLSPARFASNNQVIDQLNKEYKESVVLTTEKKSGKKTARKDTQMWSASNSRSNKKK